MTAVEPQVFGVTDSKVDVAHDNRARGSHHRKPIRGSKTTLVVCRRRFNETKLQVPVHEHARVDESYVLDSFN
jgi:hypothetical protein